MERRPHRHKQLGHQPTSGIKTTFLLKTKPFPINSENLNNNKNNNKNAKV